MSLTLILQSSELSAGRPQPSILPLHAQPLPLPRPTEGASFHSLNSCLPTPPAPLLPLT